MESILPYALTSLQRVKDRIFDTNISSQPTSFDKLLTRMINSCTDWFERETGGRRFAQTTYNNEIYSAYSTKQMRVVLRQAPVFFSTITGNLTNGSAVVTNVSTTTGCVIGMPVAADNIQNTLVTGGNQVRNNITAIGTTTITLAAAATANATAAIIQVNGLINFQWRPGTPATNPAWFNFIPDQYQLINNGQAGLIRLYGFVPMTQDNMIRVTYSAGYPISWANAGDNNTHLLPGDISELVESLVVRRYMRRQLGDKASEALEGATTSWSRELNAEDKAVIGHYRRMSTIF
jgi:hypothetical protein